MVNKQGLAEPTSTCDELVHRRFVSPLVADLDAEEEGHDDSEGACTRNQSSLLPLPELLLREDGESIVRWYSYARDRFLWKHVAEKWEAHFLGRAT